MGERKVIQKYYPPDFDYKILPPGKKNKSNQVKVRMMLPMSIRCQSCGEFLYKGTKFNSRKEIVYGEEYLGLRIFRFYMKCTRCSAELTIKTDPKNDDYVSERGCLRLQEPWKIHGRMVKEKQEHQDRLEKEDAMKLLEYKTADSKAEMEVMADLDEIKSMRAVNNSISIDKVLESTYGPGKKTKVEEDEEESLAKKVEKKLAERLAKAEENVHRIDDETYTRQLHSKYGISLPTDKGASESSILGKRKRKEDPIGILDSVVMPAPKKKRKKSKRKKKKKKKSKKSEKKELNLLLGHYGSDEE